MSVKLLTEHHLEFISLKGGCTGSSETTLVKMPHCWKSHAMAQLCDYKSDSISQQMGFLREKTCLRDSANNTGADQPAPPHRLISAFVLFFASNSNVYLSFLQANFQVSS